MDFGLYVGTVGTSMWSSEDLGQSWARPIDVGLYLECRVFSLTSQPADGGCVLAGTDQGVYRWHAAQKRWEHLPSVLDEYPIWSLVQSPHDRNVLLAGTRPAALFRSEDAGRSWTRLPVEFPAHCRAVERPRVTQILFDPQDPLAVWAGVEIDGVYRSSDGGRTWDKRIEGLISDDIHGLAVVRDNGRRKLFATTNKGLHLSLDGGESWQFRQLDSEWQYTRAIVQRADGQGTIFLSNGNGPPGSTGRLLRSRDYGETWSDARLPGELNSTLWCIAVHPSNPNLVFVCTNYGQLYLSEDGGDTWAKLKREFGEIRALLMRPLASGQGATH
jgi:photosystem II stability/assembly factor-like uncharacterized protein